MKVLVTGATGFVGAHTAAAVQAAGHDLRLLVRSREKAARVAAAVGYRDDDVVVGDITDADSVAGALEGCDAVVHAAAAVSLERHRAAETLEINETGARNVLCQAVDRGVGRVVHVSSTSALQVRRGVPLSGDSPVSAGGGYAGSKAAAERIARELQAKGAPVHVTYPSGVIGPAAGESLGETSEAVARFIAVGIIPTPHGSMSVVDVRDVAAVHCRLLADPDPPPRVMCGGYHLSLSEVAAHLHAVTGRRFVTLPTPARVLRAVGRLGDLIAPVVPFDIPVTHEAMTIATTWPGTDDNVATLGVAYRDLDATIADAVRAWFEAGLLSAKQAGRLVGAAAT